MRVVEIMIAVGGWRCRVQIGRWVAQGILGKVAVNVSGT